MGIAIKNPVPNRVKPSFVIFDIRTLGAERQSARMSKNTNDGLTRSGTGCFIASKPFNKGLRSMWAKNTWADKENFTIYQTDFRQTVSTDRTGGDHCNSS